jgi:hypothetical protein
MRELVVMARDETGVLADITERLGAAGVNILSIAVQGFHGEGIVNLEVNDEETAVQVLQEAGYHVTLEECLLVTLADHPGELARITNRLRDAAINIRSAHILDRRSDQAIAVLTVDDPPRARELLADVLVKGTTQRA